MKKTTIRNRRLGKNQRAELEQSIRSIEYLIDMSDTLKYSYFWSNFGNASSRAYLERKYYASADWTEGEHVYECEISTSFSRQNCYVHRSYKKDGQYTNLTAVKASLKRLLAIRDRDDEIIAKAEMKKNPEIALAAAGD